MRICSGFCSYKSMLLNIDFFSLSSQPTYTITPCFPQIFLLGLLVIFETTNLQLFSYITILTPEKESDPSASNLIVEGEEDAGSGVDLRTLRAIRVLRPLKLVSGVPSKYTD